MNSAEQIRVVIVDVHALVRAGIRALLTDVDDVRVVADTNDAGTALAMARQAQAQVLIVDRCVGGEDGVDVARMLREAELRTQLLLLTVIVSQSALESLLQAGARGYLTRTAAADDLIDAVRTVARGGTFRCPMVALRVGDAAAPTAADLELSRYQSLTEREREVLVCTAHGFTAPEIGARLNISPKTVDTYKQRIQSKLGLLNRAEYVRLALRLRLMDTD